MNKRNNKTIEILSPAKNLLYAKEAIKCGADAVYIGAPKFSMRSHANNSLDDIAKIVEYAHRYWVKVYIALNCLLFSEDDFKITKELIDEFYKLNIDGLIIQDLGILELELPPIPIILSTTVRCYTKEDVQFFEKCGISRIVLTRELNYAELEELAHDSEIELEAFCFGFLCSGYNGNCYITYIENLKRTKSSEYARYHAANHGVCFARCMGNWTLYDSYGNIIRENDRLLNLRFLNLYDELENLYDIGIDSFKIEGRERDLKFVKNATALFSKKANIIAKKKNIKRSSSGHSILGFEPDFDKNFNKGYTDFFFRGRKKEMYSKYDVIGKKAGIVKNFDGISFQLQSDIKLNIGDRLRYKLYSDKVKSIEIIDKKDGTYYIKECSDDINGLELYLYYDVKSFSEVENSINYRVISVRLLFLENNNSYKISAIDEDSNAIEISCPRGTTKTDKSEFYKLDENCEFIIDNVESQNDIYIDSLDDLRNNIFEKLRVEREQNRPHKQVQITKNNYQYHKKELTYQKNITNKYTKAFWLRHGVKTIEDGFETLECIKNKKGFSAKYCIKYELGYCTKLNQKTTPLEPWTIKQDESGNKYRIEFDCNNCEMHFYCIEN